MKKAELYNIKGVGLIIPLNTGIVFTNQVCGTACLHPELEGIFVPFNDCLLQEDYRDSLEYKLIQLFAENGWGAITKEQAEQIDNYLSIFPETKGASVDLQRLEESYESWVWINVEPSIDSGLSEFGSFQAVLTWQNSD